MTDIYFDGKIRLSPIKDNIDKIKVTIYDNRHPHTHFHQQIEFVYDRHNLEYKLDKMLTLLEKYNARHGGNLIKTQYHSPNNNNNKTIVGTYHTNNNKDNNNQI
jgi:hypothetical protein